MARRRVKSPYWLPFLLLIPPMLSRYSEVFGATPCWWPGVIQRTYVAGIRMPILDSFLLAWVPRGAVGLAADLIAIYLLFGNLNAKTVNFAEQSFTHDPVGVWRILGLAGRGQWSGAWRYIKYEIRLMLTWPRTISLFRIGTSDAMSRPKYIDGVPHFSILVDQMTEAALTAVLVMPVVSAAVYYIGLLGCGPLR